MPLNAAYEIAPGVCLTTLTTVPVASSVRPLSLTGTPPITVLTNTARVPELRGRLTTTIFWSAPPASFQFVTLPEKMSWICFLLRFFTFDAGVRDEREADHGDAVVVQLGVLRRGDVGVADVDRFGRDLVDAGARAAARDADPDVLVRVLVRAGGVLDERQQRGRAGDADRGVRVSRHGRRGERAAERENCEAFHGSIIAAET